MDYTEAKENIKTEKPPGPLSGGIGPNARQCNVFGGVAG